MLDDESGRLFVDHAPAQISGIADRALGGLEQRREAMKRLALGKQIPEALPCHGEPGLPFVSSRKMVGARLDQVLPACFPVTSRRVLPVSAGKVPHLMPQTPRAGIYFHPETQKEANE
jgi:hypothetical protein